jgi:hypothetical protein
MACPSQQVAEPIHHDPSFFDDRVELIAADPTPTTSRHYAPYPCVLVRLTRVNTDALRDLLGMAWKFVTAQKHKEHRG